MQITVAPITTPDSPNEMVVSCEGNYFFVSLVAEFSSNLLQKLPRKINRLRQSKV